MWKVKFQQPLIVRLVFVFFWIAPFYMAGYVLSAALNKPLWVIVLRQILYVWTMKSIWQFWEVAAPITRQDKELTKNGQKLMDSLTELITDK